jgi:hypothetical protein
MFQRLISTIVQCGLIFCVSVGNRTITLKIFKTKYSHIGHLSEKGGDMTIFSTVAVSIFHYSSNVPKKVAAGSLINSKVLRPILFMMFFMKSTKDLYK